MNKLVSKEHGRASILLKGSKYNEQFSSFDGVIHRIIKILLNSKNDHF